MNIINVYSIISIGDGMKKKKYISILLIFSLAFLPLFGRPVGAKEQEVKITSMKEYEEARKDLEKEIIKYYNLKDKYDLSTDGIDLIDLTYKNYYRDVLPLIDMNEFTISELEDYIEKTHSTFDFIEEEHRIRHPLILDINKYYADVSNMKTYHSHALDANTQKDIKVVLDTFTSLTNFNTTYKYVDTRDIWDIKYMFMMMEKTMLGELKTYYSKEYKNPVKLYESKKTKVYDYLDQEVGLLEDKSLIEGIKDGDKIRFLQDGLSVYGKANDFEELKTLYISKGAPVYDKNKKKLGYLDQDLSLRGSLLEDGTIEFTYQGKKAYVYLRDMKNQERIYYSKGANLRDIYKNRLGYLDQDQRILGLDYGEFIKTDFLGSTAYVDKDYLRPYKKLYIAEKTVGLRADGKKVLTMDEGQVFEGEKLGGRIYFSHKGEDLYIDSSKAKRLEENYISKGANLRDSKGKKVSYLKKGERVSGLDQGTYVEVKKDKKTYRIDINYLDLVYEDYESKGARIRNAQLEELGYLDEKKKFSALDRGEFLELDYKGQRAFIAKAYSKKVNK